MPITPTNKTKNAISPSGRVKSFVQQAVYGLGVYGIAMYGIGTAGSGMFINKDKSTLPTYLEMEDVTQFLLESGAVLELEGGNGSLVWTNKTKN